MRPFVARPARVRIPVAWRPLARAAVGLALVITLPFAGAAAQVVASTFGNGDSFDGGFGQAVTAGIVPDGNGAFVSQAVAASFTYGLSVPRPLGQFRFAATANDGDDPLDVRFLSGVDVATATTLEHFTFAADAPGVPAIFTARSLLFPLLQPGQTYWIVLAVAPTAASAWAWNVNDQGVTGVSVQNPLGTAWISAPDADTPAFDVTVSPEPGLLLLLGFGLAGVGLAAGVRRRHPRALRGAAAAVLVATGAAACAPDALAPRTSPQTSHQVVGPNAAGVPEPTPPPDAGPDNVVVVWNDAALQSVRETHPPPTAVARALAVVSTAVYDAWAAYDPTAVGTRLGGTLRRPAAERTVPNTRRAVSFAAALALVDLFPHAAQVARVTALLSALGYDPADLTATSLRPDDPAAVARQATGALLAYRHADGSNQSGSLSGGVPYGDYTGYVPVNTVTMLLDPNRWQPLRVSNGSGGFVTQKAATPFWGRVTPFALTSGAQFRPLVPPARYDRTDPTAPGSRAYVQQADEVLAFSARLTDRTKMTAEYWADGPSSELPPGHWTLFAKFVSRRDHHTVGQDAAIFFALTNAMLDASVVAWDAKRVFDSERPVTAIHFLYAGRPVRAWAGPYRGTQLIDGAAWQPYQASTVVTPPFPEYFSGHSLFSAAAAEVLARATGGDRFGGSVTFQRGSSRVEPGAVPATAITLLWPTFSAAANEAGLSRRYGGIHFVQGDTVARRIGRLVGAQAWSKAQAYIGGTATLH